MGTPRSEKRDYAAEQAQREEMARRAGFSSYWAYRVAKWGPDYRNGPGRAYRARKSRQRRTAA